MLPREEQDEGLGLCTDCSQELGLDASHAYFGEAEVQLCWDCALKRGGHFDEERDEWRRRPNTAQLPDERHPHA